MFALQNELGRQGVSLDDIRNIVSSPVNPLSKTYGAKGDGVADDTEALQAAIDVVKANGGELVITSTHRITARLEFWSSTSYRIRFEGSGEILVDFEGVDDVALRFTNPDTPSSRAAVVFVEGLIARASSNITFGKAPCLVEHRYCSGAKWNNCQIFNDRGNTAVRMSACFNVDINTCSFWNGGYHIPYKDVDSDTTFSISDGGTTLTASADTFASGDAGKPFFLTRANVWESHAFVIDSYTSATEVEVTQASRQTISSQSGGFGGVRGSMTASGNTLTLEANVASADDIGRVVYVPDASEYKSGVQGMLRTTITARPAANQYTLADTADVSVSDVPIIFSPAVEFYQENASNGHNDLHCDGMHIERYRGCGLLVQSGVNVFMDTCKVHGRNDKYDQDASLFNIVFDRVSGGFDGDIEGHVLNTLGKIYVTGQQRGLDISGSSGTLMDAQPYIKNVLSESTSMIGVGSLRCDANVDEETFVEFLSSDGSSNGFSDQILVGTNVNSGFTGVPAIRPFFRSCGDNSPFVLDDDEAASIPLLTSHGQMAVHANVANYNCIAEYGTSFCNIISQGSSVFEASTSALTGTDGTDTKVTIGFNSGRLYIENRSGSARTFYLTNLGGATA